MRIVVFTQYFWPEQFIINDLVACLAKQGHELVVVTGKPNYPEGEIYEGYRAAGLMTECFADAVEVIRLPLRPRLNGGVYNLLLNYLSFVWSGLRYLDRVLKGRRFDVVFVYAPSPILQAIPAAWVSYRRDMHLAIWIQDLWPESLAATGFIKNSLALRFVGWIVKAIYAAADTLLVQSRMFQEPVARYARVDKIVYYPNSFEMPVGELAEKPLPSDLTKLLESHFCVVFAGNIGTAQAIETLIDAAARLRDLRDFRLVLVGSGSMLEWVKVKKREQNLDNVVLAGRFPMSAMSGIYRRAAALAVTLKDEEIFARTIPSKVQAYLAAGKPIIGALNGEGARVIEEAKAGLTCPAEDAEALASRIRELHSMPLHERARMGEAGYTYFREHFEMGRQAARLVEILEERIAGGIRR